MKVKQISKELIEFNKGMSLILESVMSSDKEYRIILDIFNCDSTLAPVDSFPQEKYFFNRSFDEECFEVSTFCEEFVEPDNLRLEYSYEDNLFISVIKGFNIAAEGLSNIAELCREDTELKAYLRNFQAEETDYNPFVEYGVIEFDKKFRGFKRALLAELKNQLGRRTFDKLNNSI